MPPRKEPLSKDGIDLAKLIEKYDIHFKGPVPSGEWPKHLRFEGVAKHRFTVFRDIWDTRYEGLKRKRDFDHLKTDNIKVRADELRRRALQLRGDMNLNERTWRSSIEQFVLERFKSDVICRKHCGGEIHESKYEAEPLTTDARNELRQIRSKRMKCDPRHPRAEFHSIAREREKIFHDGDDHEMKHMPDDLELQRKSGISMRPDKVIGLTSTHADDMVWNPLKGISMTCPFLVVEAKKESKSPGFKSVERQTAFPIRRMLQVQAQVLASSDVIHEPPLVWFLAYQGEEWRLYAGTLERRKRQRSSNTGTVDGQRLEVPQVCVYDLWHGDIESQDGALQLLQVVDHIWTWARDIYRPGIKKCLENLCIREPSPVSTIQFYGTPSLCSESTFLSNIPSHSRAPSRQPNNASQPQPAASASRSEHVCDLREDLDDQSAPTEPMDFDQSLHHARTSNTGQNGQTRQSHNSMSHHQDPRASAQREGAFDPSILSWADLHHKSPNLSSFATVGHANYARFTFCIRDIVDFEVYLGSTGSTYTRRDRWKLLDIHKTGMQISRKDLACFRSYWTQQERSENMSSPDEIVRATIIFRTYLHPESWHIVKEIVCVIWPSQILDEDGEVLHNNSIVEPALVVDYLTLSRVMQPLRQLTGSRSVLCAHRGYILLPCLRASGVSEGMDERRGTQKTPGQFVPSDLKFKACLKLLEDDDLFTFSTNETSNADTGPIALASAESQSDGFNNLPDLPDAMDQVVSLIVMKPASWSMQTAKFCLFVLQGGEVISAGDLRLLLEDAIRGERMIGDRSEFLLTKDEKAGIRHWAQWLQSRWKVQ